MDSLTAGKYQREILPVMHEYCLISAIGPRKRGRRPPQELDQPPTLKTRRVNAVQRNRLAIEVGLLERNKAAYQAEQSRAVRLVHEELRHIREPLSSPKRASAAFLRRQTPVYSLSKPSVEVTETSLSAHPSLISLHEGMEIESSHGGVEQLEGLVSRGELEQTGSQTTEGDPKWLDGQSTNEELECTGRRFSHTHEANINLRLPPIKKERVKVLHSKNEMTSLQLSNTSQRGFHKHPPMDGCGGGLYPKIRCEHKRVTLPAQSGQLLKGRGSLRLSSRPTLGSSVDLIITPSQEKANMQAISLSDENNNDARHATTSNISDNREGKQGQLKTSKVLDPDDTGKPQVPENHEESPNLNDTNNPTTYVQSANLRTKPSSEPDVFKNKCVFTGGTDGCSCTHFPCIQPDTYHSLGFHPDTSVGAWHSWIERSASRPHHRLVPGRTYPVSDAGQITPDMPGYTRRQRLGKEEMLKLEMNHKKKLNAATRPPSWNTNYGEPTPYKRLKYPVRLNPVE